MTKLQLPVTHPEIANEMVTRSNWPKRISQAFLTPSQPTTIVVLSEPMNGKGRLVEKSDGDQRRPERQQHAKRIEAEHADVGHDKGDQRSRIAAPRAAIRALGMKDPRSRDSGS
jgi:hypothetical protein